MTQRKPNANSKVNDPKLHDDDDDDDNNSSVAALHCTMDNDVVLPDNAAIINDANNKFVKL